MSETAGRYNGQTDQKTEHVVDEHDPLNWSWRKKHTVLAAICYMTFMTDFLAGYGLPMIVQQSKDWGISLGDATRSLSGNTFMQGAGGLFAVPLTQRYGTYPVMFWSTLMTLIMTVTCSVTPGWIAYIAVRVIQGFFGTVGEVIGLTVIQDIFYFEEHARKVGIWSWAIIIGPYFGPFLSAFVVQAISWRPASYIVSGIVAFGLVLVVLLMDETTYDRQCPDNNPQRPARYWPRKIQSLAGVTGHRAKNRPTIVEGALEIFSVLIKPQFLCLFLWHGLTFCWSVGINGSLIAFLVRPVPEGYGFNGNAVGLIYFAPMIAVVCGELFGHFFNDWIQAISIKKNKSVFQPEARLWMTYFSTVFMVVGLVLLGIALQNVWHWGIVAFFWGIFVFAVMTATVVVSAYELDCFPQQSAAASALLNLTRVLFGCTVPLFQTKWADAVGAGWSFGTQAIICFVAFGLVLTVQRFGKQWREKTGLPIVVSKKSAAVET